MFQEWTSQNDDKHVCPTAGNLQLQAVSMNIAYLGISTAFKANGSDIMCTVHQLFLFTQDLYFHYDHLPKRNSWWTVHIISHHISLQF